MLANYRFYIERFNSHYCTIIYACVMIQTVVELLFCNNVLLVILENIECYFIIYVPLNFYNIYLVLLFCGLFHA